MTVKARRIAKQRARQDRRRHQKQCCVLFDLFWWIDAETQAKSEPYLKQDMFAESTLDVPIPRAKTIAESDELVDVYVYLDYPLQDSVPESARESTFKARTVKDVCLEVRRLYEAIYAEDERLGGITATAANAADPDRACLNRPMGPWVYGHDIHDLAIEFIEFEWISPTHCHANLFIGS